MDKSSHAQYCYLITEGLYWLLGLTATLAPINFVNHKPAQLYELSNQHHVVEGEHIRNSYTSILTAPVLGLSKQANHQSGHIPVCTQSGSSWMKRMAACDWLVNLLIVGLTVTLDQFLLWTTKVWNLLDYMNSVVSIMWQKENILETYIYKHVNHTCHWFK